MPAKVSGPAGLVLHNKGAKLLAFVMACVAWYTIQEVISFEKPITDIPISVDVDEAGWAVFDMSPQTVSVVFRGPEETIWDMDREKIRVQLKIKASEAQSTKLVPIQLRDVTTPRGVRAVAIDPPQVYLSLDQEGQTNLPVKATINNELPQGFEIEEPVICKPATVTLFGPKQRLVSTEIVRTEAIDLDGVFQSFTRRVPVVAPSDSWGARVEPDVVEVTVKIVERSATREFNDLVVRAMTGTDLPAAIKIWPAKVDVVLEGRSGTLDGVDPASVQAYVDCAGLAAGSTYDLPLQLHLPAGVKGKSLNPESVEVEIK